MSLPIGPGNSREQRRPWAAQEDAQLVALVKQHGKPPARMTASGGEAVDQWGRPDSWVQISAAMPARTGKQCRDRWLEHLCPNVQKAPWKESEIRILCEAQSRLGNVWGEIAKLLPGKSQNNVKNYWHLNERKKRKAETTLADLQKKTKIRQQPADLQASDGMAEANPAAGAIIAIEDTALYKACPVHRNGRPYAHGNRCNGCGITRHNSTEPSNGRNGQRGNPWKPGRQPSGCVKNYKRRPNANPSKLVSSAMPPPASRKRKRPSEIDLRPTETGDATLPPPAKAAEEKRLKEAAASSQDLVPPSPAPPSPATWAAGGQPCSWPDPGSDGTGQNYPIDPSGAAHVSDAPLLMPAPPPTRSASFTDVLSPTDRRSPPRPVLDQTSPPQMDAPQLDMPPLPSLIRRPEQAASPEVPLLSMPPPANSGGPGQEVLVGQLVQTAMAMERPLSLPCLFPSNVDGRDPTIKSPTADYDESKLSPAHLDAGDIHLVKLEPVEPVELWQANWLPPAAAWAAATGFPRKTRYSG